MSDQQTKNPSFAFAYYAASAATTAIHSLSRAGLIGKQEIKALSENLELCRGLLGSDPHLNDSFEGLSALLKSAAHANKN
ncbi:hypothetical protein C8024_07045 [Sphingopyxis sp. BSNA05]|nr:hypothetical protein [Sphingopyxis sp. BSNA05]